jgi:hypothetical protein
MVDEGWKVIVGGKCGAPEGKKLVDITMREMGLDIEKFSSLESCP